jgi:hypothetical protein
LAALQADLDRIGPDLLAELLADAWENKAPARLRRERKGETSVRS